MLVLHLNQEELLHFYVQKMLLEKMKLVLLLLMKNLYFQKILLQQ